MYFWGFTRWVALPCQRKLKGQRLEVKGIGTDHLLHSPSPPLHALNNAHVPHLSHGLGAAWGSRSITDLDCKQNGDKLTKDIVYCVVKRIKQTTKSVYKLH